MILHTKRHKMIRITNIIFGKDLVSIDYNVLSLAVSGGFGTQNCQTKTKLKWNTKI